MPSRSLRRARRRYEIRVDTAFADVVAGCARPGEPESWIDGQITDAYVRLHELGWAHSIEAWDDEGLAGGLYGVSIGGLFAAESMFHARTDASKAALVGLVELLRAAGEPERRILDAQWLTPHLETLGAVEVTRGEYRRRLDAALDVEAPSSAVRQESRPMSFVSPMKNSSRTMPSPDHRDLLVDLAADGPPARRLPRSRTRCARRRAAAAAAG